MKFVTACVITAGKTTTINFPVLTKQSLVPNIISLTELKGDEEVPLTGVLCRVHTGSAEVGSYGEPSFKLTNVIDLSSHKGLVDRNGKVSITITNRTTDPKRVKVYTDYRSSFGSILLEEKIDHFDNLLNDIHSKGFCTRLVISFNKPIETLEFASVANHIEGEGEWIQPFNVPIDNELDVEDQVYTIDFAEKDLGPLYSENLNFLEMRVVAKKVENDREPLYLYATAYGFPYHR